MATLRCKEPFAANVAGVPRVVSGGQLVDSADPIVKGREQFFEQVDDFMAKRSTEVEQATAAPGEKRSRSRAAKKAAPVQVEAGDDKGEQDA